MSCALGHAGGLARSAGQGKVGGSSTGGPAALETLLPLLPRDLGVPVVIVQHMPKLFTRALADRLDRCCQLPVAEAWDGVLLQPGSIWLAQGDSHLTVRRGARGELRLGMEFGRTVCHCRPSVDVLFRSVAESVGAGARALVLTGMGSDGVEGARAVVQAGGTVLAQDQKSSAVWGMPGRVAEAGLASAVLPLEEMAERVMDLVRPVKVQGSNVTAMNRAEVRHGV